jgi:tape measure domain-containing protein
MSNDVQIKLLVKNVADVQKQLNTVTGKLNQVSAASKKVAVETNKAAASVTSSMNRMSNSVAGVVKAFVAFEVIRTALSAVSAEITKLQSVSLQLKAVSGSAEEFTRNLDLMYTVATRTGTALADTGVQLTRFTRALQRYGGDADDAAVVLDTLNKAFLLTGTSGSEATSVLTQMSQALTAGALSGDEFRSFAENAGLLVDELAKTMGVSVTGLKKLGAEGKITGDKIVETAIRVNQQFTELFNETGELPLDRALNNAVSGFEQLLLTSPQVQAAFNQMGGVVLELAQLLQMMLADLIDMDAGFDEFTQTMLGVTGPIQLVGRAIGGLIKTFYTLIKAVKFVADFVYNAFAFMVKIAASLAAAYRTAFSDVADLWKAMFTFDVDAVRTAVANSKANISNLFSTFDDLGKGFLQANTNDFIELADGVFDAWTKTGNKLKTIDLKPSGNVGAPKLEQDLKKIGDAAKKLADDLTSLENSLRSSFLSMTDGPTRAKAEYDSLNLQIQKYIDLSAQLNKPVDLALVTGLRELNDRDYARKIQDINREWEDASIYLDDAGMAARAYERALEDIARKGEDAKKSQKDIEQAQANYTKFVKSLREAEMLDSIKGRIDSLFSAIAQGSDAVINVIKQLVAELIAAIAYAAILEKMGKGAGSFGKTLGSILTGGGGAAQPGRAAAPNIRIMNFSGGAIATRTRSSGDIDIIVNALAGKLASGGSPLDKALSVGFGLSRRGV